MVAAKSSYILKELSYYRILYFQTDLEYKIVSFQRNHYTSFTITYIIYNWNFMMYVTVKYLHSFFIFCVIKHELFQLVIIIFPDSYVRCKNTFRVTVNLLKFLLNLIFSLDIKGCSPLLWLYCISGNELSAFFFFFEED